MIRAVRSVVDVMKIPANGDPLRAIVAVDSDAPARPIECDVLVVGGGLGGVAAALAAARRGHRVCLLEETDWVGGQATSQGVSALDEHGYIEAFGGTRSYYAFREAIREHYRKLAGDSAPGPLNPGGCWVSAIAFEPLVEQEPRDLVRALQDAKRVSLGFAYWLQTEAPNPNGDPGFPELALVPAIMGSADGLCKYPYIRESRRIKALRTIIEQDVAVAHQPGPRAAHFADSVGVGWYPIDIHQAGAGDIGVSTRTKPFQIPMGALIPARTANLIAANKNIGTTHITNGCYRLHPVEWNIGEAAGTLAAFALERGLSPRSICQDESLRLGIQRALIDAGVPCVWLTDVPVAAASFPAAQRLVMAGGFGGREDDLSFAPDAPIDAGARAAWINRATGTGASDPCGDQVVSRAAFAQAMLDAGLI